MKDVLVLTAVLKPQPKMSRQTLKTAFLKAKNQTRMTTWYITL